MQADSITNRAMRACAAQKREELLKLVRLVEHLEPQRVLEIGTLDGGTLSAWCACAADKATIVSIDLPNGQWGGGYLPEDKPRLEGYAERGQALYLLQGDSHSFEMRQRASSLVTPCDFLFIDGDHSYEGVRRDFHDYAPLVRKGGYIAFHDIMEHPLEQTVEVNKFWDEIAPFYKTLEFCVEGDERTWGPWGGIGVVEWTG